MPTIPDLTSHNFDSNLKHVGYLGGHIPEGKVPDGFVDKVRQVQSWTGGIASMGFQTCPYCGKARSSLEPMAGRYIWPEMLAHYVEEHGYKPPDEFITFIMEATKETLAKERKDYSDLQLPPFDF